MLSCPHLSLPFLISCPLSPSCLVCGLNLTVHYFILFPQPLLTLMTFLSPPSSTLHPLIFSLYHCSPPHLSLSPLPTFPLLPSPDIRLRVRAEYLEHESALRDGVSSDKQHPQERQFELFSQAEALLRSRDLGSIVCDIKFTELDNLEAFWGDYLSGALLEALKAVFITDSLRRAAGTEGVRLLISVDQDDYEEGRRLLRASSGLD